MVSPSTAARPARPSEVVPETIDELWALYKAQGDRPNRDRIILHYAPLVKYVAGRVGSGLPHSVDQGDLVSYGVIGLIDAIEKFEPERAVKFETYAMTRIRGAILDELRALDWVPRSVRAKARAADRAFAKLEHDLARAPSDEELAAELGIAPRELSDLFRQTSVAAVLQLDESLYAREERGELTLGDSLADRGQSPAAVVESAETKEVLIHAIAGLGDRERTVLTLYYYEGLNLAEIGSVLGVTESRACQIHTKAVLQLRRRLRPFLSETG
jgi:RNA polymerase sigma factor for flagellar operon FliA